MGQYGFVLNPLEAIHCFCMHSTGSRWPSTACECIQQGYETSLASMQMATLMLLLTMIVMLMTGVVPARQSTTATPSMA